MCVYVFVYSAKINYEELYGLLSDSTDIHVKAAMHYTMNNGRSFQKR